MISPIEKRLRFPRRSRKYFLDKYLNTAGIAGLILFVAKLGDDRNIAFVALAVSVISALLAPRPVVLVSGGLSLLALRGLIGGALHFTPSIFFLGIGSAAAAIFVVRMWPNQFTNPWRTDASYTIWDLLLDAIAGTALLYCIIVYT